MRLTALLISAFVLFFSFIFVPVIVRAETAPAQPAAAQPAAPSPTPQAKPAEAAKSSDTAASSATTNVLTTGVGGKLKAVTSDKWDWAKQWATIPDGIANMASCATLGAASATDACPVTIATLDPTKEGYVPTTMLAYHGEGGGMLGMGIRTMAYMYDNRPASGTQYLARAIHTKFGLEPDSAYAQVSGSGAAVLKPVETLWQLSRNIAYMFFIFIFLAIGFMIMFRQKLNPQTVISVQNALPGLVVGLILVTFSFFLAGLIVDLAFFLPQVLGALLLQQTGLYSDSAGASQAIQTSLNTQNIFGLFWSFIYGENGNLFQASGNIGKTTYDLMGGASFSWLLPLLGGIAACANPIAFALITATGVAPGLAACAAIGAGSVGLIGGQWILNSIIFLIVLFGLLQALAKLFFQLLTAYVTIMLLTIFGPIYILLSTIPGNNGMFSTWWRVMLANTLLFPAIYLMFVLVRVILQMNPAANVNAFGNTLPLFAGLPASFMQLLLAYGILLASPAIHGLLKDTLKAKISSPFLSAASKNLKTGYGFAGAGGAAVGITAYKGFGGAIAGSGRVLPEKVMGVTVPGWYKNWVSELSKRGFSGTPPKKK